MDKKELAQKCREAKQCRFCKPEVRSECWADECWKGPCPRDNMPPCVYYGLIKKLPSEYPEEDEAWRRKWFAARKQPYVAPRPIKNLFTNEEK